MGSLNPLFVGPAALEARGAAIAEGLAASITQGTGQFCTKPGLVFVPDTEQGAAFERQLGERVAGREPGVLLNPGIHAHLCQQVARTAALPVVSALTPPPAEASASGGLAYGGFIVSVSADDFLATPALWEEHFGPVAIVIRCAPERMPALAARLEGTLTATLHADAADEAWAAALCDTLADKTGRLVWNGYPTGVAVVAAIHHGGPWPSSSSSLFTSVGTAAIRRFLRPVAFQNLPDALLPEALRAANPAGIQRNIDGRWTREPLA
jgi:NADP-dependent aldehyde dehydrogenase